MNDIQEKINKQIDSLPKEMQNLLSSIKIREILRGTIANNNLNKNQEEKLYSEVYLVLLGLTPITSFINILMQKLEITEAVATAIATNITDLIFSKVKDSLLLINNTIAKENLPEEEIAIHIAPSNNGPISVPEREDILSGIETPESIDEHIISVSSLQSNQDMEISPEIEDTIPDGEQIQIRKEITPNIEIETPIKKDEIKAEDSAPLKPEPTKNLLDSLPKNIMEAKLKGETFIQKEEKTIEDTSKLPKRSDQYRETI